MLKQVKHDNYLTVLCIMQARIYQVEKTPGQSSAESNQWSIDFVSYDKRIDNVMGWTAANETVPQAKLYFYTKEDAINFVNQNGWKFEVIKTPTSKIIKKSYADNFLN